MVLYIKLAHNKWTNGDYTNDSTYDLHGNVYSDAKFENSVNIKNIFTSSKIYFIDDDGNTMYSSSTASSFDNSAGVFRIQFTQSTYPSLTGRYRLRLVLEKSGTRVTCIGVNGSDIVFFEI